MKSETKKFVKKLDASRQSMSHEDFCQDLIATIAKDYPPPKRGPLRCHLPKSSRDHGRRMRDPDDHLTLEMPLPERPLQVLEQVISRYDRPPEEIALFLQNLDKAGRLTGDLEMLIAVRDYRKKQLPVP